MTEAEFEAYMKREITQEEINERVAWYKKWGEDMDRANAESPLQDDIIDYCKGRKLRQLGRAH
jgi:hypothetical protein